MRERGNVVSIPRENGISNQYTMYYVIRGKVDENGYVRITLTSDGKSKEYLLHRLVAKQFIPNLDNLPQVNHKNGIKTDNRVCNLEWCSAKQNKQHAYDNLPSTRKACIENLKKINDLNAYHLIILKKDGESLKFNNTNEASSYLQCHKDRISHAIKHHKLIKGYEISDIKGQIANEED